MTYKPGSKNDTEILDSEAAAATAVDKRADEGK